MAFDEFIKALGDQVVETQLSPTMLFDDFLAELGDLVVTTELTPRRYFIPGSDRSA